MHYDITMECEAGEIVGFTARSRSADQFLRREFERIGERDASPTEMLAIALMATFRGFQLA